VSEGIEYPEYVDYKKILGEALKGLDPSVAAIIENLEELKNGPTIGHRIRVLCKAKLFDEDVCKQIDKIVLLPEEAQKRIIFAILLSKSLKSIGRSG